ncbi:hypothetical protein PPYR_02326 [Photinus pyralis]|uniref:Putative nuclease HARBI1 n=1 Tax=Photinus pyralis TaxID=7054 RepID=A0A5N4B709_PHOPY|nr:hypothetical protein PPYR_02326 [Photinus pyralis]
MLNISETTQYSRPILQVAGDFAGVHKSTASRIVDKVSRAIAQLKPQYINMPESEEDIERTRIGFYEISRFPRCIGAIDCSHIKIQSPGGNDAELYRNRNGYFSINIQVVCDASLLIRNIVSRWPGSAHDSHIFRNSRLHARLENGDFGDNLLLGDSGYAVKSYLITPLLNPVTPVERLFNEAQIRARNPVERCFGVLKRRFPGLALGLRVNIAKTEAIIVAAAVLHNIACNMRDRLPPNADVNDFVDINVGDVHNVNHGHNDYVRQTLIQYFRQLL